MAIHLGRRQQLALRYGGIAVAAVIAFVLGLQATFPYDRVKDKFIEALSGSYDVTIAGVDRGLLPGSVTFRTVSLTPHPSQPGEIVAPVVIDSLHVDLGIFALLGMTASIDVDAKIGNGRIKGNIALPKFGRAGFKVDLTGTELPGGSLPLKSLIGLPVLGKLEVAVDLVVPVTKTKAGRQIMDWSKADGDLALGCPSGCTLGDGKTKLKPLLKNRSQQAMVADGIDFGKLDIDTLSVEAKFTPAVGDPDAHSSGYKSGKFDVTKFDVKSKEGELHVDYSMTLAPDLNESIVTGCLRFNVNDSLLKTEEGRKTYASITTSGAEKRSDGLFHIRLSDHLKDMKRLNQECGPNAKPQPGEDGAGLHAVGRPTITVPPPHPEGLKGEPPPHPEPPPPPPPTVDAGVAPVTTTINAQNLNAGSAPVPPGEGPPPAGSDQPQPAPIP